MFAFCNPNMTGLLQGEHPLNSGPKSPTPCWFGRRRHSIANCRRMVTDSAATRKLPSLFLMVPSLTPYDLPFPQNGGSICPHHTRMAIFLQRVIRSTSCLVIGGVFGDGGSNGAIFDSNKFKMAAAAILDNFEWPHLHNSSRSTYIARIARSSLL